MAEIADRTLPGVPVFLAPMIADANHGMGVETIEHDGGPFGPSQA